MEALLQPLLTHPGDPATLRVLSDALLELNDPWGEAIRLALDLERTVPGQEAHRLGHRRLTRLQQRYGSQWQRRVQGKSPLAPHAGFFRAIPSRLQLTDNQLATLGDAPIAVLCCSGAPALAQWPGRAGLVELELTDTAQSDAVMVLSSGLNSLTALCLPWKGDVTLELLADAKCTPQLERLRLQAAGALISPPQLDRLMKLPLGKLKNLELVGLELGQPGAERLAAMPWALERLTLAGANLGVKGTVAFASIKALSSLRELTLRPNTMGPTGATALATSPNLKQLVSLDLNSTASGGKTLLAFFEALALPELRALRLASCGLKGKLLGPLAAVKSKALAQLSELDLSGNLMGDDGLTALVKSKAFTNLRVLNLTGNALKGPGVVALGKSALLAPVEELRLAHNKFQNTGAKGLAASKNVKSLKVLTLGHNWMGVQGLDALLDNPALTNLEELQEGMNNSGAQLLRSFAASQTLKLWSLVAGPDTPTVALEELFAAPRAGTLELLTLSCRAFDDGLAEALVKGSLGKSGTTVSISRIWCNQLTDDAVKKLTMALGPRLSLG